MTPGFETEAWFSANMRAIRRETRITQSSFAKLMRRRGFKWHQATVYKAESGTRRITLSEAAAVAQILGTPLEHLIRQVAS